MDKSIERRLLVWTLCFGLMTVGFLLLEKQEIAAQDFDADNAGSQVVYTVAKDNAAGIRYACRDNKIVEENAEGQTTVKEDCGTKNHTCYALDNQVKNEYQASCIYNPPVSSSGGGGGSCPTPEEIKANKDPIFGGQATMYTCKYFNPGIDIFNTNLPQSGIDNYVTTFAPQFRGGDINEFRRRVNIIIDASKAKGLNPALLLGYWRSESGFGGGFGCLDGTSDFASQVQCALRSQPAECAASRDANSVNCRRIAGNIAANPTVYDTGIKLPIATFDDFAEAYGPKSPNLLKTQPTDDGVNRNCLHTYNSLIETAIILGACQSGQVAGGGSASCPIPNGSVTCGSKTTPVVMGTKMAQEWAPQCGHCGVGYSEGEGKQCTNYPDGTSNAIDVALYPFRDEMTKNDFVDIYFPTIKGHVATFSKIYSQPSAGRPEEIQGYSVNDLTTGEKFYVQFHHTAPGSGVASGQSGDKAAKICGAGCGEYHTHVQIQTGSALGQGRWLDAADFFCRDNTKNSHFTNVNPSTAPVQ